MANPEHLAILKQGVEQWNKWRKEHPELWPHLSAADLEEAGPTYLSRCRLPQNLTAMRPMATGLDVRSLFPSLGCLNFVHRCIMSCQSMCP
jgi:hypothetical protein